MEPFFSGTGVAMRAVLAITAGLAVSVNVAAMPNTCSKASPARTVNTISPSPTPTSPASDPERPRNPSMNPRTNSPPQASHEDTTAGRAVQPTANATQIHGLGRGVRRYRRTWFMHAPRPPDRPSRTVECHRVMNRQYTSAITKRCRNDFAHGCPPVVTARGRRVLHGARL